jgi:hypothetical protein
MSDDEQGSTFGQEPTLEEPAAEGFGDEMVASAYPGESIVHRITHFDPLDELKDAAKWGYHKVVPERHEEPDEPAPGGIVIDIPSHEEVAMRSTWVEHDDPPPPDPDQK